MKHSDFQPTIPFRPKLSEADLDLRELERAKWQREREALQLRLRPARPLPAGCDQQSRYDTRPHGPAEASTDFGADDIDDSTPEGRSLGVLLMLLSSVISVCIIAALAAYPWGAAP
jgi:hypothetical protein